MNLGEILKNNSGPDTMPLSVSDGGRNEGGDRNPDGERMIGCVLALGLALIVLVALLYNQGN